ncbi:hypothetical protein [Clostridium saccharoperbutylacetonicum]|uniref:hypothetical protein n=1 Tax=Clostridium saccharoperbutylacetonicum TaxID=36745 RepID=UPI0039E7719E
MRKTKSFSYDEDKDKKVIEYLSSMDNSSAYIVNLIRADMNKKSIFTDEQKNEILKIIQQYITDNELSVTSSNEKVDSDILEALGQFDDN